MSDFVQDFKPFIYNIWNTPEQKEACNMVLYGYSCKEKVHHDFIHLINEYIRSKK